MTLGTDTLAVSSTLFSVGLMGRREDVARDEVEHSRVENRLYPVPDAASKRRSHPVLGLPIVWRLTLNPLSRAKSATIEVKASGEKVGWDYDYLLEVM